MEGMDLLKLVKLKAELCLGSCARFSVHDQFYVFLILFHHALVATKCILLILNWQEHFRLFIIVVHGILMVDPWYIFMLLLFESSRKVMYPI
jgi:hypothetical protein